MLEHRIDYSEIEHFTAVLQQSPRIVGEESHLAMTKSLDVLEGNIAAETPVNSGMLRGSIAKQITGQGVNLTGEVATPLMYGLPVETGRKPGRRPPKDAIKLWVIRKLGLTGREADSAAFLIARAIGRRGTKGAFMFQKGFERSLSTINRLWDEVPARVIKRLAKE